MSSVINRGATALALSAGLLSGCGDKSMDQNGVEKMGEQVCTRSLNLLSTDPANPNSQVFHTKGLIYPIIADCSTTIESKASTNAVISFTRSKSLKNPTTGKVVSSTVDTSKKQIADFAATINKPVQIWANVKPYYTSKTKPNITIVQWSVQWNTSAEGRVEWGDKSLLEHNAVGNTQIATERAKEVKKELISALESTWATVQWKDMIKISAKINPLNALELGRLYEDGLNANGNWKDVVMERIREYNTEWITSPVLDEIIWQKRFAKAGIQFTATGTDRIVDTSHWNYAYWLGLLSVLWLAGGALRGRSSKR
jgi:hypothetical protein